MSFGRLRPRGSPRIGLVEALDEGVLIYLPRLDKPGFDAAAGIPLGEGEGSELRPVVQSQRSGFGVRLSLPGGRQIAPSK